MIVYWIRDPKHKDIFSEGYVGITSKTLEERVREHRKNKRRSIVSGKLRENPDLVYSVVHEVSSLEDALALEKHYRPIPLIGWNLQSGGGLGVEPEWYSIKENRQRHSEKTSEATRRGIAAKDSREARSKRAKLNWERNRDSYVGASRGDKNPKAKLTELDVHTIKYLLIPNGMTNGQIAHLFGVKAYLISFIRTGKNWSFV